MKNIQTVNKLVARDLNYSEDLVESINKFYWKTIRRQASEFEHTSISIKHIGILTVSRRAIIQEIYKCISKIRGVRRSTKLKESTKQILISTSYDRLRKLLVQRNILAKQYFDEYAKKVQKYNRVHSIDSLSNTELGQDSGGNNKSSEDAVQHSSTGNTRGDSEEKTDMLNMSI